MRRPESLSEAVRDLRELGSDGAPLAGGTWIMRAPQRGERLAPVHVSLDRVEELRGIQVREGAVVIGALTTHDELAAIQAPPAVAGLTAAAGRSAFPAVRSVATLGGNIAAVGFPEADLVPALLAADARVELALPHGEAGESLAEYLRTRHRRPSDELIARVIVPAPPGRRSAFERLTVRGGGEYAVASVAASVTLDEGVVRDARVAVGSVERMARLCPAAAAAMVGEPLQAATAQRAGSAAAAECTGRDGLDAPGWYREAVLPALLRRAVESLIEEER